MKKLLILCMMLFAVCLFLTACGEKCEQHVYDDCADTECNQCKETRDSMHTWVDADCTTPKTCKTCGKTEGEALGHTPEADDGDCTTPVICSACEAVMEEANEDHHFIYELKNSSENENVFMNKCEHCQSPDQTSTVTIIIEHGSVALTELRGKENEPVFLFTDPDESYQMYNYKVDAQGNENVYLEMFLYTDDTCEDYNGSDRGHGMLEGETYMSLNQRLVGLQVANDSDEPVIITVSFTLQDQAQS